MALKQNKYTRLVSNTVLFAISTFSSKVLSFALTRLYTSVLEEASYGIVDLITACANLLIPLVSLGISNAVIRFGLEKSISKSGVFTSGLISIAMGFSLLLLFSPLVAKIEILQGNQVFLYLYVLISCLRTLCCQFVRAKMYTKLYAVDGIMSTIYTVGFNVLFLLVFKWGTTGYLLSIIAADALSIIGLFIVARLNKYLKFRGLNLGLLKNMLKYSLPLVPASMFWWVANASDRFFIAAINGPAENGLYAAANKVPSIVAIMSTLFTEAWQLSAVTDGQDKERDKFFTKIFRALAGIAFLTGGALIYGCKVVMHVLVAPGFFASWQYVPILIISTVFSTLVNFQNSIYMVEKKSGLALITMMFGAVTNLILNSLLIEDFGPNGAATATLLSFMLVFVLRVITTRKLIKINYGFGKLFLNTLILLCMAFIMLNEINLWVLWCGVLMAVLLAMNGRPLYRAVRQLLKRRQNSSNSQ